MNIELLLHEANRPHQERLRSEELRLLSELEAERDPPLKPRLEAYWRLTIEKKKEAQKRGVFGRGR